MILDGLSLLPLFLIRMLYNFVILTASGENRESYREQHQFSMYKVKNNNHDQCKFPEEFTFACVFDGHMF